MIIKVHSKEQLNTCLSIIHRSFAMVADEFGLTQETCPVSSHFDYSIPLEGRYSLWLNSVQHISRIKLEYNKLLKTKMN